MLSAGVYMAILYIKAIERV